MPEEFYDALNGSINEEVRLRNQLQAVDQIAEQLDPTEVAKIRANAVAELIAVAQAGLALLQAYGK